MRPRPGRSKRVHRMATAVLLAMGPWGPSFAQLAGGCVDDVTGSFRPAQVPNNCTAGDVVFVDLGLGTQTDGCVSSSDTVTAFIGATVRNTVAQVRYDVGLYLATDGDPNADGAKTGACIRQRLTPVGGASVTTCPPLDLAGGGGPFVGLETSPDACGDLNVQSAMGCDQVADLLWDDSRIDFGTPLTFPCRDLGSTGFVDIPSCTTWGNQADEVDVEGDATCDGDDEVIPGTKAKCNCDDVETTIPAPQLGLSCSCSPPVVDPQASTTCTVSYVNSASCTPDMATTERFRCGTASFVRFELEYDETLGAITDLDPTRGSTTDDLAGRAGWVPASFADTPGIVAPGESASLTFEFTQTGSVAFATPLFFPVRTYWSDVGPLDPSAVAQVGLTASCVLTAVPLVFADGLETGGTTRWDEVEKEEPPP